jgi:hypothetical protein
VVIGLFPYASDARRAVHALHEEHFTSDQIIAAFRAPAALQSEAVKRDLPGRRYRAGPGRGCADRGRGHYDRVRSYAGTD